MDTILIEGVGKRFGILPVLQDVSASLRPGEVLSLVGPFGCGKTTLLRILAGLETADSGRVRIGARDVTALRPADRDVAMVFQNYALYPHLTAGQNMAVPLVMRRLSALERLPLLRHPTIGPVNRLLGYVGVAPVNWFVGLGADVAVPDRHVGEPQLRRGAVHGRADRHLAGAARRLPRPTGPGHKIGSGW